MTPEIPHITDASFDVEVLQSPLPTVVDFTAEHCPPCRTIAPLLAELSKEFAGRVRVVALDTTEQRETAVRYGVRMMPTLLRFEDGKVIDQLVGAAPIERLRAFLAT